MKTAAIFLVFLAGYATSAPSDHTRDLATVSSMDRLDFGWWNWDNVVGTFQSYTSYVGNLGDYAAALSKFAQAKFQQGGEITMNMLASLVAGSLGYAQSYGYISGQQVADISATFNLPTNETDGHKLEAADIAALIVEGNPLAAQIFKDSLVDILGHQANPEIGRAQILRELAATAAGLLKDNAAAFATSYMTLETVYNLKDAVVDSVTHPVRTAGAIATFIKELQPKVAGMTQSAAASLYALKDAMVYHATNAANFSMDSLRKLVNAAINYAVASEAFDATTGSRLLSTFSSEQTAEPFTVENVQSELIVNSTDLMAKQFQKTVEKLIEMKNAGSMEFVLLSGLGASVLNLVANQAVYAAATLKPLLRMIGLTNVIDMIDAADKALTEMQAGIPAAVQGSEEYMGTMKTVVLEKLAAGGEASEAVLLQALSGTLTFSVTNGLFDQQAADSLAATFGAQNGAAKLANVNDLKINAKDGAGVQEFRTTVTGLLAQQSGEGFADNLAALVGVNMAVMDLLAANSIVQASSLLGLKAFLMG